MKRAQVTLIEATVQAPVKIFIYYSNQWQWKASPSIVLDLYFKTEVLAAIKIVIPVIYTQILVAVCRVYCIISLLILLDVTVIAV